MKRVIGFTVFTLAIMAFICYTSCPGHAETIFPHTEAPKFNGLQIDNVILDDQEAYALVLRMPYNETPSLDDFDKIYIANTFGGQIPLTHIASDWFIYH